MSYSALYHQILTAINPIQPRTQTTPRCDPLLKAKSQTGFIPKRQGETKEVRVSKSSEQPQAARQRRHDRNDPRTLLIPAIMTVERARIDLKVSPRTKVSEHESASSTHSGGSLLRWCGKSKKTTQAEKRGPDDVKRCLDIAEEETVAVVGSESPPSETTTDSSCNLRLDLRSSELSYNPSSLRTSEIPASLAGGTTYRCLADDNTTGSSAVTAARARRRKKWRPHHIDEAYLLSLAERAVEDLLEAVIVIETAQAVERDAIEDPVERAAAETRDRKANDEFVRSWLVERQTWLGTLKAARFGELWEAMRRQKNDHTHRGISFGAWLREKRDKTREEQAKEELKRREKEEAQQVRREKAQQAYDKWLAEAASRPALPQLVMYTTERGTHKYVRRGAFCNPNPWVDILEEERAKQQLMASRKPCTAASRRLTSRPPPTRKGAVITPATGMLFPLRVTRLGGDVSTTTPPRRSTYDNVVEFYADLLRRCRPRSSRWVGRRREGVEVPVHGHTPVHARTPVQVHTPVHAHRQAHARTPVPTVELVHAHDQIHTRKKVHTHTPLQAPGPVHAHMPVDIRVPVHAHTPVHAQELVYAPGPIHAHALAYAHEPVYTHELVYIPGPIHGHAPVHAPRPIYAHDPVYAHELVYAPGPINTHAPVYMHEPIYAHKPVYAHELVYAPGPINTHAPVYAPGTTHTHVPVHTPGPEHPHVPVPIPGPIHSPGPEHAHVPVPIPGPIHSPGPEHAYGLIHANVPVHPPTPVHAPGPIHVLPPVHAHVPVQAPVPTHTLPPVHAHEPVQAPVPTHTLSPVHAHEPVQAPVPTHALTPVHAHEPVQAPVPTHALTPVHGRSPRKSQVGTVVNLTTRTHSNMIAPPTESLRV